MDDSEEREFVGARISAEKKSRITDQLMWGETIQDWLEDAIDRKLHQQEAEGEGGNVRPAVRMVD